MERMSTLDAGFFFVEHENVPMHLGSLALFEGPALAYDDLVRLFAAKLPLVPRYRQVVRTTPLHIFRPAWADDEHFEIGYHLRHAAVPKPGGDDQLRNLAARIYAQRLDRARPLWEAWFLEGIEGGRWAILSKVHHCMVDGIGGTDLMTVMFDIGPDAERPAPASWEPDPGPSVLSLVSDGLADTLTWPLRQLTGVPGFLRQQLRAPGELVGFGRGLTGSARRLATPAASSLNGSIGPHRRWAWMTASLSEVKEIRGSLGGTVNDVLLAAITRGFRDLLLYILGRRMEGAFPYVPIGNNVRISVAIFSYLDQFSFGITADYDAVTDLEVLAEGIGVGVAELADHSVAARRVTERQPRGKGQGKGKRKAGP